MNDEPWVAELLEARTVLTALDVIDDQARQSMEVSPNDLKSEMRIGVAASMIIHLAQQLRDARRHQE